MNRASWLGRMAMLFLLCLAIPACTGNANLTKANVDKIKPGMTLTEVEAVLGKGDSESGLDLSEGSSAAGALGVTTLSAAPSRSSSPLLHREIGELSGQRATDDCMNQQ